jgi:hypothetical protein
MVDYIEIISKKGYTREQAEEELSRYCISHTNLCGPCEMYKYCRKSGGKAEYALRNSTREVMDILVGLRDAKKR